MSIPSFLLASNSPRRRQMLQWMQLDFEAHPVGIDETPLTDELPVPYVMRLARSKALAAVHLNKNGKIILAADTIVADGTTLLGKPEDEDAAREMLRRLRGRTHTVCTALTVVSPQADQIVTDCCVSQVPMRSYTDEEIEAYISSGDPLDKAGAYAIQHPQFHPVENFEGCFASVMGLPLCHFIRTLRQIGVDLQFDMPQICRANLDYDCSISVNVLCGENIG